MAARDLSFEMLLQDKPTLDELCEHIMIGIKWYQLGIQLKLDVTQLDVIDKENSDVTQKTAKMFQLWLSTNTLATRKHVLEALRKRVIGENNLANEYEKMLTSPYISDRTDSSATKATAILQWHIDTLSQSLINPVKVSQLLFSKRCISEATLDEMEILERPLDEKKTTLLSAIQTTVSSDHKKLKVLATVLSKFEETRVLSEKIFNDYAKSLPDDQTVKTRNVATTDRNNQMSREDHASDILRCHYGTLSQSLRYPIRVAQLLHKEGVISVTRLDIIKTTAQSYTEEEAVYLLLKEVRRAVHAKYHDLEVFANVLSKFKSNAPYAKSILEDFNKYLSLHDTSVHYNVDEVSTSQEVQTSCVGDNEDDLLTNILTESFEGNQNESSREVQIPRTLAPVFGSIRKEFALTFSNIRKAIETNPPPLDALKQFLKDGYPHLKPQLAHSNSIDDVLDVVNDQCTLININCLEGIVERFKIKEAEKYIEAYKNTIQSFCKNRVSNTLGECFKGTKKLSLLQCETAVYVLDWIPRDCTLEDVKDILAESVEGNVQICNLREGESIVVTCFFPLSLTPFLIAKAQETLHHVKERGLISLTIGYCTIYDKSKRDEEVKAIVDENTKELTSQLELQQKMNRKKSIAIVDIEDKKKQLLSESLEKQRDIEELQEIITSLTLQVRERDKQIEDLKQSLKDLGFISKARKSLPQIEKTSSKEGSIPSLIGQEVLEDEPKISEKFEEPDNEKQSKDKIRGVEWSHYDNRVYLTSPTTKECKDVVRRLKKAGKEWSVHLQSSSSESTQTIIDNLNKCTVKELHMVNAELADSMTTLSEKLLTNETMKMLRLQSSQLNSSDIKQVSEALHKNTSLEALDLWNVSITDEDTTYLSDMLIKNRKLKVLDISDCDISDKGVENICNGLKSNQTLTELSISKNPRITSVSTPTIVELIKETKSLETLFLRSQYTSLTDDDIKEICLALACNTTIKTLGLSKQHKEYCKKLDNYKSVKERLEFA